MEILPEFLFAVVFSLLVAFLLSFVLPMVLSMCPWRDVNDHVGLGKKKKKKKRELIYDDKYEYPVGPEILDRGSLRGIGFVEKVEEVVKVDDFVEEEESKEETLVVEDVVGEDVGGVCLSDKFEEEERFGAYDERSSESHEVGEIEVDYLRKIDVGIYESRIIGNEEIIKLLESDGVEKEEEGELVGGEEDDWEGVERSELERVFGAAVAFVGCKSNADRFSGVGSDVKKRLDALHRIATRGPCLGPQPMAFKVSARAKWNAWQRLGNMSAEVAMEQYIALLSGSVPGWMQDVHDDFADAIVFEKVASDLKTLVQKQSEAAEERELKEVKAVVKGLDETGVGVITN